MDPSDREKEEMRKKRPEGAAGSWWGDKGWEDCWRQDRVDAVGWGLFFLWGAAVLLVEITGFGANYSWWNGWAVLFIGAGVITLAGTAVRLVVAEYRRKWLESLVWGLILLAIGGGMGGWHLWGWGWVWVLVLALIGLKILAGVWGRPR